MFNRDSRSICTFSICIFSLDIYMYTVSICCEIQNICTNFTFSLDLQTWSPWVIYILAFYLKIGKAVYSEKFCSSRNLTSKTQRWDNVFEDLHRLTKSRWSADGSDRNMGNNSSVWMAMSSVISFSSSYFWSFVIMFAEPKTLMHMRMLTQRYFFNLWSYCLLRKQKFVFLFPVVSPYRRVLWI